MIMISSKAGQRLAKALAHLNDLDSKAESDVASGKSRLYVAGRLAEAQYEFQQAAKALGEEMIADKHHLVEGD